MLLNNKVLGMVKSNNLGVKALNMNFGPNHPAAHGVLRLALGMDGEIIKNTDVHIGLLHRGTEKLMESKPFNLSIPYFDRLDYVSMMVQEHAYCLALEKLMNRPTIDQKVLQVRTVFDELTRILNHLLAVSCHALDVGSMSPLFWAFEEREKIMVFYEAVSGARMHAAYYRPVSTHSAIPDQLCDEIVTFVGGCQVTLSSISGTLTENRIWKERLLNIGTYGTRDAISYGLSGVMARCTGLKRDVRFNKLTTYGNYYFNNYRSFVTVNGDSLDRYLLRLQEMFESLLIVTKTIVGGRGEGQSINKKPWFGFVKRPKPTISMEKTIEHFKNWGNGKPIDKGLTSQFVESPKGEFGVTLLSSGDTKPYRCKIRSPAYNHIQFLPNLVKNRPLADLITLIGTIDIVFGEIDR